MEQPQLSHAGRLQDLFRFLLCLVLFQAGVSTVVVVAAIYAQEVMGFSSQQLIVLIMVVNITAALGAFLFGFAQDRFGSVPSLTVALPRRRPAKTKLPLASVLPSCGCSPSSPSKLTLTPGKPSPPRVTLI